MSVEFPESSMRITSLSHDKTIYSVRMYYTLLCTFDPRSIHKNEKSLLSAVHVYET